MKCPICKNELEIKNKAVGKTENGETIYNEYAICHECKKQWNLDKQRAKSASAGKEAAKQPGAPENPEPKKKRRPRPEDADRVPRQKAGEEAPERPRKKRRPRPEGAEGAPARPAKPGKASEAPENPETKPDAPAAEPAPERPRKKKRPRPEGETGEAAEAPRPKKKKRPRPEGAPEGEPKQASSAAPRKSTPESDAPAERPRKKKRPANVKPAPRAMDEPIQEFTDAIEGDQEERPRVGKRRDMKIEPEEQMYSNIPPRHIRESREQEMRENYQNMLDEGKDEEEHRSILPIIIILIIILLIAAAGGYYFFFLR